ncbi:MAG: RNA 3'-terminal phosphate cyclase, partial [Candidatus Odinarchaeota archaeon]
MNGTKQNEEFLTIDGSVLEGGGSILRLSIAFSVITGQSIEIINIRKGRSKPGLATQHLVGLQVMAGLFGLQLEGAFIGSDSIRTSYGKEPSPIYNARIKTAGSVSLVFQPVLIASVTNERKLQIQVKGGGTFGKAAPPVDYLENVYCSILRQQGIKSALKISKHGF